MGPGGGGGLEEVAAINRAVVARGPEDFLGRTRAYWELWVDKSEWEFGGIPGEVTGAFRRGLLVLRTKIDHRGAITAANDHDIIHFARDTYSYVWPRDGALVARALDLSGHFENSRAFFDFCHKAIEKEGYFLHKYNPDGSLASSWHPWQGKDGKQLPIQEDGTGLVVWALWNHVDRYRDVEWMREKYRGLVASAADWMASYVDPEAGLPHPSFDLWEERYGVHAFTVAATWAGLVAASRFAWRFNEGNLAQRWKSAADGIKSAADRHLYRPEWGRFARTVTVGGNGEVDADGTVDASLYGLWYFGMYPPEDPRIIRTMESVRERLWVRTDVGGLARYENDPYHRVATDDARVPGNPWFICTLWLAQWHIARAGTAAELAPALEILQWVARRALPSGVLAEQVHPYTNSPPSVSGCPGPRGMRRWNDELAGREPHVVGVHDRVPRRKDLHRHGARSGSEVPGPSGREGGGLHPGESAGGAAPVRRLRKPVGSGPGGGGAEKIAQGRETGLGKEYYLRALNGSPVPEDRVDESVMEL